ncbi:MULTISPECIES: peptidylprolyl isomerase [unclassified Brevundimonas]|uniref:peptidylprolyl isomerase n=1 Tax=unclassified Brevundimonas TaxID=2622653 RepID=UPI0006FF86D0|nr:MULTISPECIES: peptidylprolyl isomerase [unclassified Brevundimonas]KQY77113.1 peptidylprolyl isomerase [Brevundimonas sp. Root1423]KRA22041.1 peptidylprolyl isomerase [Brevundimonas sp. Root608]
MRLSTPFAPVLIAVCMALSLGVAACGRGAGADRPPEPGDRAVAKVQDQTIWASDVKREAVAQGLVGEGEPLDVTSDLFRRVLDEVIDQKLLAAEADRRGLDNSALAQRRLEATRERILGDMLVETVVNGTISDRAVETIYQEQVRLAQTSEEIRVRLILSRTRPEADAVIGILAQGAAFEAVAAESSIDDATRYSGGDLGYRTLDVMPEAYANALRDKPAGSTVGPFQTEGGWAVLRVEDRRRETPPTLEQARPQIVRYLTYEGVRQLLEQLRGKAKVDILLEGDAARTQEPASAPRSAVAPAPAAPAATAGPAPVPAAPAKKS